ncbi:MAG: hypothetical protein ACRC8S_18180 [Fimbriiglobus sp.]
MAKFYSLEESAARLGIPVEDFKRRLKTEWTSIRPFRDGATLRFRTSDIDELARSLGAASDPGLTPGPVGSSALEDSDELSLAGSDLVAPLPTKKPKPSDDDEPLLISEDDSIFSSKAPPKRSSDSDVRLDFNFAPNPNNPELTMPTEEISIDLSGPSSAIIKPSSASGKLSAPKSGTKLSGPESAKIPSPMKGSSKTTSDDSSSEFELSLDPSNDSLELELTTDSSEEIDLGGLELSNDPRSGQSGINLGKPADSGLSLEKKSSKTGPINFAATPDDSSDEFELSLDAAPMSGKLSGPKSFTNRSTGPNSDSEFELTLDENSGIVDDLANSLQADADDDADSQIFETDFDVPSLDDDSGSAVVEETDVEGGIDLDMSDLEEVTDDDSASQVLVVDDDAEPILEDDEAPRSKKKPRSLSSALDAIGDEDLEEGESASGALRGVRRGDDDDDDNYGSAPVQQVVAAPAKWGALPGIVLLLTLPLMFLGALMSYESVRGMWGYHQPTQPSNSLVRGMADLVGLKTGD